MLLVLIGSYLVGSIPFGLILSKFAGYGDIRNIGSGNIGATNVLRTGNKKLAALTLLLDSLKGAAIITLYTYLHSEPDPNPYLHTTVMPFYASPENCLALGFLAVLGHNFPIWLKFKGGKGVATTLGVLLAAVPYTGLAACALWLATFFFTRISSASALAALAAAPIVTLLIYGLTPAAIVLLIAALVFFRHKDNIRRLLKGEEPKFSRKK